MTPAIEVVRHPRARRAKLSVDPVSGAVRLTLPPRARAEAALRWAEGHRDWIAAQRAKLPEPRPFVPGVMLSVGGEMLTLVEGPAAGRRVERVGERLICGGPADGWSRRVERWLKGEALRVLTAETRDRAAAAGVSVTRVAIGDARGRWGSCSSSGTIRYSWRLILAPDFVRRATVAHEVAHRVHMNHGPDFHRLAADLFGADPTPARAWLRAHGTTLHGFGRSSPAGGASR